MKKYGFTSASERKNIDNLLVNFHFRYFKITNESQLLKRLVKLGFLQKK